MLQDSEDKAKKFSSLATGQQLKVFSEVRSHIRVYDRGIMYSVGGIWRYGKVVAENFMEYQGIGYKNGAGRIGLECVRQLLKKKGSVFEKKFKFEIGPSEPEPQILSR